MSYQPGSGIGRAAGDLTGSSDPDRQVFRRSADTRAGLLAHLTQIV